MACIALASAFQTHGTSGEGCVIAAEQAHTLRPAAGMPAGQLTSAGGNRAPEELEGWAEMSLGRILQTFWSPRGVHSQSKYTVATDKHC